MILADRAIPFQTDQFQIRVLKYNEMIHRTEAVVTLWRYRKTQTAEKRPVRIQIEPGIDDKMVK